jgi:hypothetical protein
MKRKRYQGTNVRMLMIIVGGIFVLILLVMGVSALGMVHQGRWTRSTALVVSLGSALGFSAVTAIALMASLRNEYIDVTRHGLLFRNSRQDGFCSWAEITGIGTRRYTGRIGKSFLCYVLTAQEREFCFARAFLPDEWLPPALQPGNPDRMFVTIERADALAREVKQVLSSGYLPYEESGEWRNGHEPGTIRLTTLQGEARVPAHDFLFALAGALLCPMLIIMSMLLTLPWSAPPLAHGDTLVFRYSVLGQARGMAPLLGLAAFFPLLCFIVVVLGGLSGHVRTRLFAWTMFALAAFGGIGYGAWSLARDYYSEYSVLVLADSLITNDPHVTAIESQPAHPLPDSALYTETHDTVVFWEDVTAVLVFSSFPVEHSLYYRGTPPDPDTIARAQADSPDRSGTGYVLIFTGERHVRIPNAIQGFSRLVREIVHRSRVTKQTGRREDAQRGIRQARVAIMTGESRFRMPASWLIADRRIGA